MTKSFKEKPEESDKNALSRQITLIKIPMLPLLLSVSNRKHPSTVSAYAQVRVHSGEECFLLGEGDDGCAGGRGGGGGKAVLAVGLTFSRTHL